MTKRFSEQFKQEALNFVQSHPSLGIATIAKQLGVGYSTLDCSGQLKLETSIDMIC
jgi:transposase-like protein